MGGLVGFMLRDGVVRAAPDAGGAPAALAADAPPDDASLERLKELEARNDKLVRQLEAQKKLTAEATAGGDAARHDLDLALESQEDRVGEMEELAARLKKDLAEARAREAAAAREAEQARKAAAQTPQDKELALRAKKLSDELAVQKRQAQAAKSREDAVRRDLERVRREDQQTLERVRREDQQTLERVRRENEKNLERVRREGEQALDKVRKELQQARADAEKYKRAAEEAKRKSK
jgi:hypothetical protein